jgi:hypothetical protein
MQNSFHGLSEALEILVSKRKVTGESRQRPEHIASNARVRPTRLERSYAMSPVVIKHLSMKSPASTPPGMIPAHPKGSIALTNPGIASSTSKKNTKRTPIPLTARDARRQLRERLCFLVSSNLSWETESVQKHQ